MVFIVFKAPVKILFTIKLKDTNEIDLSIFRVYVLSEKRTHSRNCRIDTA